MKRVVGPTSRAWRPKPKLIAIFCLLLAVNVSAVVRYVNVANPSPLPPHTNWADAAVVIQDAVDLATDGDEIVVTNGTYAAGGRLAYDTITNRVAITNRLVVRSVNGPEVTFIEGYCSLGFPCAESVRCVTLSDGAVLIGFTLAKGAAAANGSAGGGGAWCQSTGAIISNCVVVECTGSRYPLDGVPGGGVVSGTLYNCTLIANMADFAGGAWGSVLNNCTLSGNHAFFRGGGAVGCLLNNCMIVGNSAVAAGAVGGGADSSILNNCTLIGNRGGGAYGSLLNNCIVYHTRNFDGSADAANYSDSALNYCCSTPAPDGGTGNITNEPVFIDLAGGNLRLQSNSPCINAGRNAPTPSGTDLDGLPRIAGGTVDIGAYEFQAPASILSYAWLGQYGFPQDGSADYADPDDDRLNNWQEWRADTVPTNSLSVLRCISVTKSAPGLDVTWQSVTTRTYSLQRAIGLSNSLSFLTLATNIAGQAGTTTYTDTNAAGAGTFFYRVRVEE